MPPRSMLTALVAYLKSSLLKVEDFGRGTRVRAVAETAVRFQDTQWFWTDDNAKAAELLCEPTTYNADPESAEAAIDFVLRMSRGDIIQRRAGPAELRIIRIDPADFRVETGFFIIDGDLTRGVVNHAMRFNDNRSVFAAEHGGNLMVFRALGREVTLDIEDAITSYGVEVGERTVSLSFTSTLRRPPILFRRRPGKTIGDIVYHYDVSADRPSVALTVTFTPAIGSGLRDVILTTAVNRLNYASDCYRTFYSQAGEQKRFVRNLPQGRSILHTGAADFAAIVQEGAAAGFSYAMHLAYKDGGKLQRIVAYAFMPNHIGVVVNRYAVGDPLEGVPIVLREERMLTGGGYYDTFSHYASIMHTCPDGGEVDPSMSYDIGAELNAVAVHVLFAKRGLYTSPPSPERLSELVAWYNRHLDRYFAYVRLGEPGDVARIFTRGIAFVILSLDCMLRATGDPRYLASLRTGVALMLRLGKRRSRKQGGEIFETIFVDAWSPEEPYLDCQAACLLALARAAWHGDPDGTLGQTAREAARAIHFYSGTVDLSPGIAVGYDGLGTIGVLNGQPHVDTGYWTFKVGLVLRALHAVGRAADAGHMTFPESERRQIHQRIGLAESLVSACSRWHGDALEILTSPLAGETNSETQPWVALGLVPVLDEQIEALEPNLPDGSAANRASSEGSTLQAAEPA